MRRQSKTGKNDLRRIYCNGQTIRKSGSLLRDCRHGLWGLLSGISHFSGQTSLSFLHTHYFMLGMFFFLVLMLSEKAFSFSGRNTGKLLAAYQFGLNITGLGFLMRGLIQVWGTELSRGLDASISGIAGIGHILMGISIILLLLKIKKRAL